QRRPGRELLRAGCQDRRQAVELPNRVGPPWLSGRLFCQGEAIYRYTFRMGICGGRADVANLAGSRDVPWRLIAVCLRLAMIWLALLLQISPVAAGEKIFALQCSVGYCHGAAGAAARGPRLRGRTFDKNYLYS